MVKTNVPVEVQLILYDWSPQVGVVLSGKGTVVLPQGGHGVAEKTWVVHVSRRSVDVTRRKLVVFIVKLMYVQIWKINVGDVTLYIVVV